MNEKEKMLRGMIYDPSDPELVNLRKKAHRLSIAYNQLDDDAGQLQLHRLGHLPRDDRQ